MKSLTYAACAATLADALSAPASSYAQGTHGQGHGGSMAAIGTPGGAPTRTVTIVMNDNYYEPESVPVRHGEAVCFVIRNEGTLLHEFNIGTAAMHVAHQPHMQMMMEMEALLPDRINHAVITASKGTSHDMSHDDPNSALVEPGQSKGLVWTFNTDADLEFACNIPGHYESGMAGAIAIAH